jgi:hypothetical protein
MQRRSAENGRSNTLTLAETEIQEIQLENPRGNAPFGVRSRSWGLRRLDGGDCRARTGDPRPSRRTSLRLKPGTGISDAETGARNGHSSLAETKSETRRMPEKPHSSAISASRPVGVRALKTGWWAHQGSNLGPDD